MVVFSRFFSGAYRRAQLEYTFLEFGIFAELCSNGTINEKFIKYRTLFITVPLSERRHRLYRNEIPEVIEGLRLRLTELLEKREEPERAEIAFRTFYRLETRIVGRPKYPDFSWALLQEYLEHSARVMSLWTH